MITANFSGAGAQTAGAQMVGAQTSCFALKYTRVCNIVDSVLALQCLHVIAYDIYVDLKYVCKTILIRQNIVFIGTTN